MAGKPPGERDIQIGRNLRRLRKRAGLTQRDVGALFGVSAAQAQKFETGRNRLSHERAMTFCASIGAAVEDLDAGAAATGAGAFQEAPQRVYLANDPWTGVADAVLAAARGLDEPARTRLAETCRRISDGLS